MDSQVEQNIAAGIRQDALDALAAEEGAGDDGPSFDATVRGVVRGRVHGPCRLGKRQSLSWRGPSGRREGKVRNAYRNCGGAKCPRCAPGYLAKLLDRTLAAWGGDAAEIHRLVVSEDEWRRKSPRVRELQRLYPKRWLRVVRLDGDYAVFTPGPAPNAEPVPVEELGRALVDALLDAPREGRQRWRVPTAPKDPDADAEGDDVVESERWRVVNLPQGITPQLLNARIELLLGRQLDWEEKRATLAYWKAWEAGELWAEEVDRIREELTEPLGEEWEAEREERAYARRVVREYGALFASWSAK